MRNGHSDINFNIEKNFLRGLIDNLTNRGP